MTTSATAEQPTLAAPPAVPATRARPAGRRRVAQLGRDTLYLLTALPMGVLTFTVLVTGWSTAISTLITIIGIPVAMLTLAATRGLAWLERRRARLVVEEPIPERYLMPLPLAHDDWRGLRMIWERWKTILADLQTWKDTGYGLLLLPVGIAGFTVAVTAWALFLALVTFPAWWWSLPGEGPDQINVGLWTMNGWLASGIAVVAGLVLAPLLWLIVRGTAIVSGWVACGLLGTSRTELAQRVERLEETRAGAVDAARLELERIERDLHDGAQARLVAVAMELGRAEQKLAAGDTDGASALVGEAREDTRRALSELRDLARGIRPALLSERGLREAVTSLASRAGVPTTIDYAVPGPLPTAVETAAYFVVGEALANVGKHARATSAAVRIEQRGDRLEVEVRDDGRGGADASGGGLTGLRGRVEALDGALLVSSPVGGPTILRAELPCGS